MREPDVCFRRLTNLNKLSPLNGRTGLWRGYFLPEIIMKAFFSFYSDALKIAIQSIFAHKLRAFLTLIGIIIGVASVVTVGASISGLNTYVVDKVANHHT